jgi:hypothetical protein
MYRLPPAFLPPHARRPFQHPAPDSPSARQAATLVERVGEAAAVVGSALDRDVLTVGELEAALARLRRPLEQLVGRVGSVLVDLTAATSDESGREETLHEREHERDLLLAQYALYDRYFGVRRVHDLGVEPLIGQMGRTILMLVRDLPFAMLGVDELRALLASIERMARMMRAALPFEGESVEEGEENGDRPELWWDETPRKERTVAVAGYRWTVGHRAFALCCLFCREQLQRAAEAIEDPPTCASCIREATVFLRGTSACLWYTTDFPARVYEEIIRPSLEAVDMPGGFSGTQNADYNHMRNALNALHDGLMRHYGDAWPTPVAAAMADFVAVDELDIDHHVLVAASKIRLGQSLAQQTFQQAHAAQAGARSAVEALRELATFRRRLAPPGKR